MTLLSPPAWADYKLIDSGDFMKLERFGQYVLARPEPQAIWDCSLLEAEWERLAHATFRRDKQSPERGDWLRLKPIQEPWTVRFNQQGLDLTLKLALTSFKHVGLFPEQAVNWTYIHDAVKAMPVANPRVLNLFAYTGGASLAARQAGADITHVDSVKQVISWARESMTMSRLDNIRWVVEDAVKFVRREERRGNTYNGLILDPPAYGRGPDGEKWVLEEQLNDLLKSCAALLDRQDFFFIINLYSLGFSPLILDNLMAQHFGYLAGPTPVGTNVPNEALARPDVPGRELPNYQSGELFLTDSAQKRLPLGVFSRFSSLPL